MAKGQKGKEAKRLYGIGGTKAKGHRGKAAGGEVISGDEKSVLRAKAV